MPATTRHGALRRRERTRVRRAYTTSRAWVRSLAPGVGTALPDIVIVGGQRCGTTSLFRYLAAHPDVVTPRSKELNALSLHYGKGPGWYAGHFPAVLPHERALEASPLYLADPRVPARAAERLPDALFVALLRDPVERAYSHYLHNLEYAAETLSFVDALDAEPERLARARRLGLGTAAGSSCSATRPTSRAAATSSSSSAGCPSCPASSCSSCGPRTSSPTRRRRTTRCCGGRGFAPSTGSRSDGPTTGRTRARPS